MLPVNGLGMFCFRDASSVWNGDSNLLAPLQQDSIELPNCSSIDSILSILDSKAAFFSLISPFQTDEASLKQNIPNPFTGSTIIPYYIPQHAQQASLHFFKETGMEITQRAIHGTGEGQILFTSEQLPAGIYFYSLQVDGKNIVTKRMVVLR